MRCSYVVPMRWMVIYGYEIPGGALNLNSTKLPRLWSPWGSFPSRKNTNGRAGNWTWELMISSQKLRPLDHEADCNHDLYRMIQQESARHPANIKQFWGKEGLGQIYKSKNTWQIVYMLEIYQKHDGTRRQSKNVWQLFCDRFLKSPLLTVSRSFMNVANRVVVKDGDSFEG
jgi:hypothetical protein